jgi:hypothetical protein
MQFVQISTVQFIDITMNIAKQIEMDIALQFRMCNKLDEIMNSTIQESERVFQIMSLTHKLAKYIRKQQYTIESSNTTFTHEDESKNQNSNVFDANQHQELTILQDNVRSFIFHIKSTLAYIEKQKKHIHDIQKQLIQCDSIFIKLHNYIQDLLRIFHTIDSDKVNVPYYLIEYTHSHISI